MKEVIGKYVITTDTKDLTNLLNFLTKYNVSAYNYKLSYLNGKISIRIKISNNVFLSIQGLTINSAESIISYVSDSKYFIEFDNVKPDENIIKFLNNLNFPASSEFHVLNNNTIICYIEGYRCKINKIEILKALARDFRKIKALFPPLNLGYLSTENVLCEIGLKANGIRNSKILEQCKICEINNDGSVKIDNFIIKQGKIYNAGKEITRKEFYSIYT
ncbi:hypothetical protein [Acidianus manzaensis]|uniref:DUF2110 family protein n=1 Tax=Acidianus manzaensis TaxID=282676 RepID=A0A1W6JYU3_9CREN|nr:hypothetical protein [Acidianus manzaensis]ARM75439.1 hypothetical protein B6F84_04945 [Acidianus manzaensis]